MIFTKIIMFNSYRHCQSGINIPTVYMFIIEVAVCSVVELDCIININSVPEVTTTTIIILY